MATKPTERMRARRDLTELKDQLRRDRRERDERIEQAALTVRLSLRRVGDAEAVAGRAIETLAGEGLTSRQIAQWCGGLTLAELRRLRSLARRQSTAPEAAAAVIAEAETAQMTDAELEGSGDVVVGEPGDGVASVPRNEP